VIAQFALTSYMNFLAMKKSPETDFRWFFYSENGLDLYSNGILVSQKLLKEKPELKARQVLSAIDLIDKSLIPHFRSHYDRLSELCHPNSMGHRSLFSKLDRETGITEFGSGVLGDFFYPVKTSLGTALLFDQSSVQIERQTETFAHAHHAAHPSPLTD